MYQFVPPAKKDTEWEIRQLLDTPASDAVLVDFDGDGEKELAVLAPFHGESISIYKKQNETYEKIYEYEKPAEFTHAIYGGDLCGVPALVVGHRKAERNLIVFTYDKEAGEYVAQVIDEDCGPANVYHFIKDEKDYLVSANRETDEVVLYEMQ